MKNVITWISLILIAASCAQEKSAEKTEYGLLTDYNLIPSTMHGKVKQVKELNYRAELKDGKITKGKLLSKKELDSIGSTTNTIIEFNADGIWVNYMHLDLENVLNTRVARIENGRCVGRDHKIADSTYLYSKLEYDNNGLPSGIKNYKPGVDTLTGSTVFTRNDKSIITRFDYFNSKGIKTFYNICTPDENGNYVEVSLFDNADNLLSSTINTYDKNNNLLTQTVTDKKTGVKSVWVYKDYKLDEHGNYTSYFTDIDDGKSKLIVERTISYW